MTKARDIASAAPAPSTVSATELGYLDGVSSAIQTQIDGKQAANANVSTTELGYLDGVTSAIQTQLDAKVAKSLVDAKGDLLVGSANDTVSRLAVASTAGYLLTVDSAEATGLKWAAPAAGGGVTLLYTSTPSGVSSINFTSISSTYKHLLLTWNGVYTSDHSTAFNVRFNNDSSGIYSVNDISGQTYAGGQYALFMEGNSLNENSGHGYLYVYDTASSSHWKTFNGQSSYYDGDFGWKGANDARGMYRSTTAITSVDIVRTGGSGTLSVVSGGAVKLWGLS
jgi:hypothetical protein